MIVIDASVAIKWFVVEERRAEAENVLWRIGKEPDQFAVPDLFYLEMMSVLVRLLKRKDALDQIIRDLFDLGLTQIRLGAKLLEEASHIAADYKLSGYDALYAACALSLEGVWLTADLKAHEKISPLGISQCL
jgi:predicted nucleic acid-binding protein